MRDDGTYSLTFTVPADAAEGSHQVFVEQTSTIGGMTRFQAATFTVSPPPTNTPVPPTVTSTPLPPTVTNTPVPPTVTNTPVGPTVTNTPVPPTPPPTVTFAPGGGSFVIGDRNSAVGTNVTFWGAQWWRLNSPSGGPAPSSFKGFALSPKTPACGTNWSARPGNSSRLPAGPLPAYMGVIVTSQAAQSGSAISGDTVHIVVVKTNPGYQPNPGHPGTGTVVAQVC
jgi:hypothetical protein